MAAFSPLMPCTIRATGSVLRVTAARPRRTVGEKAADGGTQAGTDGASAVPHETPLGLEKDGWRALLAVEAGEVVLRCTRHGAMGRRRRPISTIRRSKGPQSSG